MAKKSEVEDCYRPVAFDPGEHAAKKRNSDPAFRAAYDTLEDEFAALATLLQARKDAGLTQADVAERMSVSQPVLARIESSLGSRKHSPSLATLRKYATAWCKKLRETEILKIPLIVIQHLPHPPPSLPLEGGGTESLPLQGEG